MSQNNHSPKITVIVPIYNAVQYLERCCQSILSQPYSNIELILSDDGSTDGSGDICNCIAANDNRVKVLHEANAGVSMARNRGLAIATGDWVMFVDADDWLEPDTFSEIAKAFTTDYDLLVFSFTNDINNMRYPVTFDRNEICVQSIIEQYSFIKNTDSILCSVWNKVYRKNIIDSIQLCFDTGIKFGEDFIFNSKYLGNINRIKLLSNTFYHYDNAVENSGVKKIYPDFDCFINRMDMATQQLLESQNVSPDKKKLFRFLFISQRWNYAISQAINQFSKQKTSSMIWAWLQQIPQDMLNYLCNCDNELKNIFLSSNFEELEKEITKTLQNRHKKKLIAGIKLKIKKMVFHK